MRMHLCTCGMVLATGIALAAMVTAHEPDAPKRVQPIKALTPILTMGMPVFVQNIAPAALEAVKVVDAFSAAVKAVKLDKAKALLDPEVLILESGGSERSRDEYMAGHVIADANFLQNAQQQLRYRQAKAEGNFAWVATESSLDSMEDGKKIMLLSTETMLLRKTGTSWRIVHIHWSSRPAKQ